VLGDVGTLSEDCQGQTVWDANVNNSILVVPYTICA
jgi:hypothetical protein